MDWMRNEGMHERRKRKDINNYCEMQEWMKRWKRNVKRQKDGKCIYRGCVKIMSGKNDLWTYAWDYKDKDCCEVTDE